MEVRQFIQAYNSAPADKQRTIRESIMKLCGWRSPVTFYAKAKGEFPLRPPEINIIKEQFKEIDLNAFTGKPIKERAPGY